MPGPMTWRELPLGGALRPDEAERLRTGGWRTGVKPVVELDRCVDCLLCWLYCPDSAIRLDGIAFAGFDYDVCKGCELCSVVCPEGAITMVADDAR
jgi:2-oxoacid:acceptor oxidoreductase delta subunit (pyruvate/2-ketoisovalerate family)